MRLSPKQDVQSCAHCLAIAGGGDEFREFPVPMALDCTWHAGSKQTVSRDLSLRAALKGLCLTNKAWKKLLRTSRTHTMLKSREWEEEWIWAQGATESRDSEISSGGQSAVTNCKRWRAPDRWACRLSSPGPSKGNRGHGGLLSNDRIVYKLDAHLGIGPAL